MIGKSKEAERMNLAESLETEDGKGKLFRAVKQMVDSNKDVAGGGCLKGKDGKIVVDEEKIKEIWRSYFEKLSNEEFVWDRNGLETANTVSGPIEEITCQEVKCAIGKMKNGKAAGPSGVVEEMLKAAGDIGVQWVADLCNAVLREGRIPTDWTKSWMVSVYKGKGDAMECGSYRGIKLLEHAMKVLERVIEARLRREVSIDEMQFGFCPGRGTMDAIFIVRQLQEKYFAKKKNLWMAFVDLEKAFDRVPREVLWWALREVGVEEWLVKAIQAMYEGATTAVKLKVGESKGFEVKVGVHQGSVLSPLLFTIVLEALSRKFRDGLPYELLYADDLVLMAETKEELMEKLSRWKENMEAKGLRVNVAKTKVMKCCEREGCGEETGKYPCGVCRKGVGTNSIQCTACQKWIHRKCSGIKGKLKEGTGYRCSVCEGRGQSKGDDKVVVELELGESDKLECVNKFCYLGDMIGAGGGAEEASRTRVRCAWGKFNQLRPILAVRGFSLKVKGKIYRACVQSVLVYASETWPMKVEDTRRLERTERSMVRRMCGVTLADRGRSEELYERLGIEGVMEVLSKGRFRWFGYVEPMDAENWVSIYSKFKVEGRVGRGTGKKTWKECVKSDMKVRGLVPEMAQDRDLWRRSIHGETSNPCMHGKRTLRR